MIILEQTDNTLTIPVGIGAVHPENEQNFYNTSDADVTENDILNGKIAYGKNGKVIGIRNAKINVEENQIKLRSSTFTAVPEIFDFDGITNLYNMFSDNSNLTEIPFFDASLVTTMGFMCSYTGITSFPQYNTSKCNSFRSFVNNCKNLETLPELDFSGIDGRSASGTEIVGVTNYITTVGGFRDLGKSYSKNITNNANKDLMIQYMDKLTHESCINIINKVYDMNLNTNENYTPKIRFHANAYSLLTEDDIALATSKGWIVQAG